MALADHVHDAKRVIVCSHVAEDGLPVLYVSHDADDDWQFLCGGDDHTRVEQVRFACWTCMMQQDASLEAVLDLGLGETAERHDASAHWRRAGTN